MPSAPPAPGVLQLEAIWQIDSQTMENTFHYKYTGTADHTLLAGVCATYVTWATAKVGIWSTQAGLVLLRAADLASPTGASIEVIPSPAVTGHNASQPLPNNCAIAVKRQTGLRGRANRGRVYHLGIAEDFLQALNTVSVAFAATLINAYTDLMTAQFTDNGVHETILHRALGTNDVVTSYVMSDLFVDSQRRRLPGHNRHH